MQTTYNGRVEITIWAGGLLDCAKDAKLQCIRRRSKWANSVLKVRYKHSEPRAAWIDSGSLDLYLQHIFKNQICLLQESGETARNLRTHRLIMPFVNSTHIFTYTGTTQTFFFTL